MKIKVVCFTAALLLVAGPARAQDADDSADDSGTDVTAQVDADPDATPVGDGAPEAGAVDAEVDVGPVDDGETVADSGADGSSGKIDGSAPDGGGAAADAGPPPPPIQQFYDQNPGCSLGSTPQPAAGGLAESAFIALLLLRRRRASR